MVKFKGFCVFNSQQVLTTLSLYYGILRDVIVSFERWNAKIGQWMQQWNHFVKLAHPESIEVETCIVLALFFLLN